jgi:multiple sugar transport system substrate-binding protein
LTYNYALHQKNLQKMYKSCTRRCNLRPTILLTLSSLMLSLGLVACGPADTPETIVETVVVKEVVEVTPEPAETVTITLAYNRFLNSSFGPGPAPIDAIKQAVAEQHPNIEVQLNLMPDSVNQMHDALAVWFTAEDPTVDLYGMDTPWVLEFGRAGWALPLNDQLPGLDENYVASGLDIFSYEGQRLGVPFWGSVSGLFFRADLLAEYGFEPPETYDDLVEISNTIRADRPELAGLVWPGAREESLVMVWADFLHGFGGQYFEADGSCSFNSPQGVEAVTFMTGLLESGNSPAETTAWKAEEARTRFVEGNAIFLWHNHDLVTWLDDPERSSVADRWGFRPSPAQPNGQLASLTGGFAFAINPFTDNPQEARQVLEIIASEDVQRAFAIAWGPVQYYNDLYEDPDVLAANPNAEAITPLLDYALNRPPSTNYAELSAVLQEELHSALTGIKPVAQAMDDACSRIEPIK